MMSQTRALVPKNHTQFTLPLHFDFYLNCVAILMVIFEMSGIKKYGMTFELVFIFFSVTVCIVNVNRGMWYIAL